MVASPAEVGVRARRRQESPATAETARHRHREVSPPDATAAPRPYPAHSARHATRLPEIDRDAGRLAVAVLVAGAATAVAFWAPGALAEDVPGGIAPTVTALGRLGGLLSGYLLLVQVVLIARVPVLERSFGLDVLTHRHRLVGLWSVWLLLAHLVLTTVGYAATLREGVPARLWIFLRDYPGMLLAVLATACIALVVVTSIRAARQRLRYASWHLLHLYAYLGIALALPHQLWNGRDLLTSPAARAFWWTSYVVAAGCLLTWRVVVPLLVSRRHDLRVAEVVGDGPDVVSVVVRAHGAPLDGLGARAGQFFVWRFLTPDGWTRGHPYSLSAAPTATQLRITVKALGEDSAGLRGLRPGTRVLVEGPYGRLHAGIRRRRVVLIGAGIGITPLRAMLEPLAATTQVTLLQRAHDPADLALRTEIEELAARHGVTVRYLLGPRRKGLHSFLPEGTGTAPDAAVLQRLVPDIARSSVHVCGPQLWTVAVRRAVLASGVPPEHLHEESFSW